MAARLRAADAAATPPALRVLPALVGSPELLDALASTLSRFGGRRLTREAVLLPADRLLALRRAARRRGLPLVQVDPLDAYSPELRPALWAAARFVRSLAEALGWPHELVPAQLDDLPAPTDPIAELRAARLLRAWTAALDAALDPLAEAVLEPTGAAASPGPAGLPDMIRRALDEARCLSLTYRGATRGVLTRRVVEPRALEASHGQTYLRAFCRWRQAERLFRLDRVISARLLRERFGLPAQA